MSKYAFIGDVICIGKHISRPFAAIVQEDISSSELYSAARTVADDLLKRGNIVVYIIPVLCDDEELYEDIKAMLESANCAVELFDELGVSIKDSIFVNACYAFGDDMKEESQIGIACTPWHIANNLRFICERGGWGGIVFASQGKNMSAVVVYNPRLDEKEPKLELQFGEVHTTAEAVPPHNELFRLTIDPSADEDMKKNWTAEIAQAIEKMYGPSLIMYMVRGA